MRRILSALALVAGLLAPAAGALAAADPGGVGIRLVDVPASARDDPRAQVYIVDRVAPGTVIQRRVQVTNTTRSVLDVAVYPAAATIRQGTFGFAAGHGQNELTTWTSTSQEALTLQPGGRAFETVTIAVPRDAPPGEQYGVIWAETAAPAPAGGGVRLVNRIGVRIYLSIGPGGAPASNFTIGSLRATRSSTGQPLVVADVHNTGGRALDIAGNLTLSAGPGALSAGPFPAQLVTTLAPGDAGPVTVRLDEQLPDGPWRARIALRSGLLERTAVARIRFPHQSAPQPAPTRAVNQQSQFNALTVVIIAGLILLAAGALVLQLRRRRASHGNDRPRRR
ncbi:MAG: hypothetical protein QOK40_65 [Miltoncostaeaceae bacterium]|nr:hypothetical protein [Miltoncostaeaceae bacterium]